MQVDPIKPKLKPPGTKRLKLNCNVLLSSFAFEFNLRRFNKANEYFSNAAKQNHLARGSTHFSRVPQMAVANALTNRRSNRHMVPLYGKSDGLFTQGLKFETR